MTRSASEYDTAAIAAVTLNWNRAADTLDCLGSLARQDGVRPRLIVVDNGSTDGSVSKIQEKFPQAEVLANAENEGFARGFNRGIRYAFETGAEVVFITNNDATLAPDALVRMLRYVQKDVGLLAPVIYYYDHPDTLWSAGNKVHPWNLEQDKGMRGNPDPGDWPEMIDQDFITGCGVLIPRDTYLKVGGFDERFQMYYEDADLCRNVREANLRILVIPRAKMWHKVSLSSGGSDSPNERYWMARSSVLFFRKHAHGWRTLVILFWRTGSALRTSLRLLREGRRQALAAYWRGLWDGIRTVGAYAGPAPKS